MTTSPTIAALLKKVKPTRSAIRVCLRGDLLGELDLIKDELDGYDGWEATDFGAADPRTPLRDRKAALEQQMRDASVDFVFENIGDRAWSDLLAHHPPREGKDETWDPATFPVALVAAAAVDPKMTEDDAGQLFEALTLAQRNSLFSAAWSACNRGVDIPFSSASSGAEADTSKN